MSFFPEKILRNILALSALYLTVFLVILPQNCLSAAKSALEMCLNTIIPSLFPFFVCSGILSASNFSVLCSRCLSGLMRPLFRLPGAAAMTFLLGTVSGYPVGAASAADLYTRGQCTKTEAERMIAFCNNSSPLFVIGVVGTGFLGNPQLGYRLYFSHILAALIVGVIFRFYRTSHHEASNRLPCGDSIPTKKATLFSLGGIIDSAVFSTLKVCGFIIFFSVFTSAIPNGFLKPYLCSLTEISGGLHLLTSGNPSPLLLPLVSLFLGFSGISVILQICSVIAPKGLSAGPLLLGKLLQGTLSFFITLLFSHLFPIAQPVFSLSQTAFMQSYSPSDLILSSVLSVLFAVAALKFLMHIPILSSRKNKRNHCE